MLYLFLFYFYVLCHIHFVIFTLQRDEFTLQRYEKMMNYEEKKHDAENGMFIRRKICGEWIWHLAF